jgi:hypothetical protein
MPETTTTNLRMFASRDLVIVPGTWLTLMGATYNDGASLVGVTARKSNLDLMLRNAGVHPSAANNLKIATATVSTPVTKLVEAGVINFANPALYAWEAMTAGCGIVRVYRSQVELVGRWEPAGGGAVEVTRLATS